MTPKILLSSYSFLWNYPACALTAKRLGYNGIEAISIMGRRRTNEAFNIRGQMELTLHLPIASRRSRDLDFSRRFIYKPACGTIENCAILDFARDYHVASTIHASTIEAMGYDGAVRTLGGIWLRVENEQTRGSIAQQLRVYNGLRKHLDTSIGFALTVDIGHAMIELGATPSDIGDIVDYLVDVYKRYPIEEVHASRVFQSGTTLEDHGLWPTDSGTEVFLRQIARFVRAVKAKTLVFEFYPGHSTALRLNFGRQLRQFDNLASYAVKTARAYLA